jgi:hypothetical protein
VIQFEYITRAAAASGMPATSGQFHASIGKVTEKTRILRPYGGALGSPYSAFSDSTYYSEQSRIMGQFEGFHQACVQRIENLRLYGGGRSLARTALSLHFPANREFYREFGRSSRWFRDAFST